jgi:hypothetical protein
MHVCLQGGQGTGSSCSVPLSPHHCMPVCSEFLSHPINAWHCDLSFSHPITACHHVKSLSVWIYQPRVGRRVARLPIFVPLLMPLLVMVGASLARDVHPAGLR